MSLKSQLCNSMAALGYNSSTKTAELEDKLLTYLALIQKWNGVHNLTAIRDPELMLTHHIIDSLVVLPHITGSRIADIGSGAGLPGIPIAIMQADWQVTLVESNQKKAAFLRQAKIELGLENVEIIAQRVMHYHPTNKFNTIISRALSSLNEFIQMSAHLSDNEAMHSRFAAMKASNMDNEIANLQKEYAVEKIVSLFVPGLNAKRHLIIIKQFQE